MTTIARDDEIRDGAPHIDGTRITVLDVKRRVLDSDEDPYVVAGEYGISMPELFTALAYYHDHREEFAEREREYAAARRDGERRIRDRVANGIGPTEQAN